MITENMTYGLPNIGCLLGIAYQAELARLTDALVTANLDITAAEYLILRVLYNNENIQQCEISRILNKDKASICKTIRSLTKKGYVEATPVSYKCIMVSLTKKGVTLKPVLMDIANHLHKELSDKITLEQMQNLRKILETIIK